MNEILKKQIELLPDKPGSYQMRDKDDNIIYIGKAKNLKKRVSQYFLRPQNGKTASMVFNVDHFSIIITNTEKEALILEMNLIQKYHPRYNILLMDDKRYPYLAIHKGVKHPYVSIARNINDRKSEFFGPYPNSGACYETLNIINKLFPLRKCKTVPTSPCLYYHLNQCLGPCVNEVDPQIYREICENISKFLKGNNKEVVNELKEKISIASENLEFEKAKEYKTMLDSILAISEKQYMELKDKIDRDFVSFNLRDNYIGIVVLIMRKGMIIFKRSFVYELMGEVNDFVVDILTQYYLKNTLPKEIIVPTEELKELLSSYFSEVDIIAPTRGQLFEILQTTKENAKEALEQHFMTARLEDDCIKILEHLGEILKIKTPYRIELFDNSHLMGTNAVGAMVCFINGEPVKKMFRKFNLDNKNTKDDLESMKEVIFRRYSRLKQENQSYPDLIIVDGGYNQLVAAKQILKSIDVDINLAGLVKNDKHQTSALMDENGNEYEINDDKPLFYFLTRMQNEVHRFAITSHINKRKKSMFKSIFDEIEGIGAKRKELLLKNYPTLQELKSARIEELEQIIPKKVAIDLKEKLENLK